MHGLLTRRKRSLSLTHSIRTHHTHHTHTTHIAWLSLSLARARENKRASEVDACGDHQTNRRILWFHQALLLLSLLLCAIIVDAIYCIALLKCTDYIRTSTKSGLVTVSRCAPLILTASTSKHSTRDDRARSKRFVASHVWSLALCMRLHVNNSAVLSIPRTSFSNTISHTRVAWICAVTAAIQARPLDRAITVAACSHR